MADYHGTLRALGVINELLSKSLLNSRQRALVRELTEALRTVEDKDLRYAALRVKEMCLPEPIDNLTNGVTQSLKTMQRTLGHLLHPTEKVQRQPDQTTDNH